MRARCQARPAPGSTTSPGHPGAPARRPAYPDFPVGESCIRSCQQRGLQAWTGSGEFFGSSEPRGVGPVLAEFPGPVHRLDVEFHRHDALEQRCHVPGRNLSRRPGRLAGKPALEPRRQRLEMGRQPVGRAQSQGSPQVDGNVVPGRDLIVDPVPVGRDVAIGTAHDQDRGNREIPQDGNQRVGPGEMGANRSGGTVQVERNVADPQPVGGIRHERPEPPFGCKRTVPVPCCPAEDGVGMHGSGPVARSVRSFLPGGSSPCRRRHGRTRRTMHPEQGSVDP